MVETKFKQTEIGLIPEDWEIRLIGDSFKFKNGLNKEKRFFGYGFLIVNYMDVYRHTYIVEKLLKGRVFVNNSELNNYGIKKGDILFTRTSETPDEIGLSSVVTEDLDNTVFSGFVLRGRPHDDFFDYQFCRYCFSSRVVRKQIIANCTYTTRALTNGRVLSDIQIPLPPLPEQQAIAEALSETDAWIESLEKLIAKKRSIKQGAMQQLLTPKEDWVEKKLGEVCEIKKGQLITSSTKIDGRVPVIAGGKRPAYFHNEANRNGKTITISASGASAGYIGFHTYPIFASDCSTISESDLYLIEFVYYFLGSKQEYIYGLQTGGAQPHIHPKDIIPLILFIPTLSKQTRIATILSDMDAEIEALEQKLTRARQIKQGMMQELLTGRIRLISSSTIEEQKPQIGQGHNEHFNDAVLIGTMASCFGSEKFPLTRFKYTKVSYLLKRYKEEQDAGYLKHAAGPYKSKTRYGGAEKIALGKKYVDAVTTIYKGKEYEGFVASEGVDEALKYFNEWYGKDAPGWIMQYKFETNDNLELWTTVDMAIEELKRENKSINVESIKQIIKDDKEWRAKLKKPIFSDINIQKTIVKLDTLFI